MYLTPDTSIWATIHVYIETFKHFIIDLLQCCCLSLKNRWIVIGTKRGIVGNGLSDIYIYIYKGFKKIENSEWNVVLPLFLFTLKRCNKADKQEDRQSADWRTGMHIPPPFPAELRITSDITEEQKKQKQSAWMLVTSEWCITQTGWI